MYKWLLLFGLVAVALANLGGWQKVDVDDENVVEAAHHGAQALSKKFAGKFHHKLVRVRKAEQQVVAGMNYKLQVIVGMTECLKAEVEYDNVEECELKDNVSTYKKCDITVYRDLKGEHSLTWSGCILATKDEV